jgi:hypothetical protein
MEKKMKKLTLNQETLRNLVSEEEAALRNPTSTVCFTFCFCTRIEC